MLLSFVWLDSEKQKNKIERIQSQTIHRIQIEEDRNVKRGESYVDHLANVAPVGRNK